MRYVMGGVCLYLLLINLWGAVRVRQDKRCAQSGAWRVPERTFFLIAAVGGCPGVYLTMRRIRHKTQHRRFMWGLPLIFLVQCAVIGWILRYLG